MRSAFATSVAQECVREPVQRSAAGTFAVLALAAVALGLLAVVAVEDAEAAHLAPANLTSVARNTETTHTFTFRLHTAWPADGSFRAVFHPASGAFDTSQVGTVVPTVTGCDGTYTAWAGGPGELFVRREGTGTTCAAATDVTILVSKVTNPSISGLYFVSQSTRTAAGATLDLGQSSVVVQGTLTVLTLGPCTAMPCPTAPFAAGATTPYRLDFQSMGAWPNNGRMRIQFPGTASFDYAANGVSTAVTGLGCAAGTAFTVTRPAAPVDPPTATVPQDLTIVRTGGAACSAGATGSLIFTGVRNPSYSGPQTFPSVRMQTNDGRDIDVAVSVPLATPEPAPGTPAVITPNGFPAVTVAASSKVAGALTPYWFNFTTLSMLAPTGQFVITFPPAYDISSVSAVATLTGSSCAAPIGTLTVAPNLVTNTVTVSRGGDGRTCTAGALSLRLDQVRNPPYEATQSFAAFAIRTRNPDLATVPQVADRNAAEVTIPIVRGAFVAPSLSGFEPAASNRTRFLFEFTLANPWPANGAFQVTFPAGFDLSPVVPCTSGVSPPACTFLQVTGCDGQLLAKAPGSGRVLELYRQAPATTCPRGTPVAIHVGSTPPVDCTSCPRNPGFSGTFPIEYRTVRNSFQWRGAYDPTQSYAVGDVVAHIGAEWIAVTANGPLSCSSGTPPSSGPCPPANAAWANLHPNANLVQREVIDQAGATIAIVPGILRPEPAALPPTTAGGVQFVAVGLEQTLVTSPDGITWTPQTVGTPVTSWSAVASDGTKWVAVGSGPAGSAIATSANGLAWTLLPPPADIGLNDVAYDGRLWVAVGWGKILTSADGTSWTARDSPVPTALYQVATDTTQWIAVGPAHTMVRSTDGVTWTPIAFPPSDGTLRSIAHDGTTWVVSSDFLAFTSTDGFTWTPSSLAHGALRDLAESNGFWVGTTTTDRLRTGANPLALGTVTLPGDPPTDRDAQAVAYHAGLWVVVGDAGTIHTSPDGVAWTARTSGTTQVLRDVAGRAVPAVRDTNAPLPGSMDAGAVTAYTFTFRVSNLWPHNGKFVVTFPAEYDLAGLVPSVGASGPMGCPQGTFTAARSGQTVTVTRSGGSAGTCPGGTSGLRLTLHGIRNPRLPGPVTFPIDSIRTTTADNAVIDRTIWPTDPLHIGPGLLEAPAALSSTSSKAGATATYTFQATLANAWPANGRVQASFPWLMAPYSFVSPTATMTGCAGDLTAPSISGTHVTFTRSGSAATSCPAGTRLTLRVAGVANAQLIGPQLPFVVRTLASDLRPIDVRSWSGASALTLEPGTLTGVLAAAASHAPSAATAWDFQFTLANDWPGRGTLGILMPDGFTVPGAPTLAIEGCPGTLSYLGSSSAPGGLLSLFGRDSDLPCVRGSAVAVRVEGITNPSVAGSRIVTLRTCIAWASSCREAVTPRESQVIDSASVTVGIGVTRILSVSAVDPTPLARTTYRFSMATGAEWPPSGRLVLDFPVDAGVPLFELPAGAMTLTPSGCTSGFPATVTAASLTQIVITRDGSGPPCPPGTVALNLTDIRNPAQRGSSPPIVATLQDSVGNALATYQGQLFLSPPPTRMTAADTVLASSTLMPVQARVLDASGLGVPGVPVRWLRIEGQGTFQDGSTNVTVPTDLSGVSTVYFQPNGGASAVLRAIPVGFNLTGAPIQYSINGGVPPTVLGGVLGRLRVEASTSSVNADVGAVSLRAFGYTAQDALLGELTSESTYTVSPGDAGSCTGAVCTLRKAGTHSIVATKGTVQGNVTVTVLPGVAKSLAAQPVAGATRLTPGNAVMLQTKALDAHGNAVSGIPVTWAVTGGGGTLSATTSTTGADGIASVTLTTGTSPGANTVTASRTGLTGATHTVTTSSPSTVAFRTADLASVQPGAWQTLEAVVRDTAGSPVSGVQVAWSVVAGGVQLSAPTSLTDANGVASVSAMGTAAGASTVQAALGSATDTLAMAIVAGPVQRLEVLRAGTPDAGQPLTFTVRGFDAYGNVVGDLTSASTLAISPSGSCTGAVCTPTEPGQHTVTATSGSYTGSLTFNVGGVSGDPGGEASPAGGLLAVLAGLGVALVARRRKA